MASADDLKFQEFDEAADLLALHPDATTQSINEDRKDANVTVESEDEGELTRQQSDETELLGTEKKQPSFWTFEYYQSFFDVDTNQVLSRIQASFIPLTGRNFVRHSLRSNPDLYGPFWICATLVFALAISCDVSSIVSSYLDDNIHYSPQFRKVTVAAVTIYSYAWLVPLGLWGFLQWRKSQGMNIMSYTFLETVCVYGYSLFIFIPTAMVCIVPLQAVQWVVILVATTLSGILLALTFWPVVRDDTRMAAIATLTVIVLLHALLPVLSKFYFFSVPGGSASHQGSMKPQQVNSSLKNTSSAH